MVKKKSGWCGPEGSDVRGFKLYPENINRKGPPRKAFSTFNSHLEEHGVEQVKRGQFREALLNLFNLKEEELLTLADDENAPMALRIMAKELLQPKTRAKYLSEVRDWSLGTPPQEHEVVHKTDFDPKQILKDAFRGEDTDDK